MAREPSTPVGDGARFVPVLLLGEARELSAKAARYLGTVIADPGINSKNKIAASRALIAHHEWRENYELELSMRSPEAVLEAVLGDRVRAIAWLRATLGKLENAEAQPLALTGGEHGGRDE